ncbi:MAG: DUF2807 domain-containing protein [Flavobacterium sp. BFFFF2]|nr:MAG: DUF2807 domain-containing protein [Flavobacterium sp. BFFFF2]
MKTYISLTTVTFLLLTVTLILPIQSAHCQIREKIKGSKKISLSQKTVDEFDAIEIDDNLEVFLIKGNESTLEIEADDNLLPIIECTVVNKKLTIHTTKEITGYKKLIVRVTYTDILKLIIAKHDANITAIADLNLDNLSVQGFDYARLHINVRCKNFNLLANDKSKTELNLKADKAIMNLSKNAEVTALVAALDLKLDIYQKANASIEGDVTDFRLRLDNFTQFTGKNFSCKNAEIITEANTFCSILVQQKATLELSGKSEIELFGEPKIELKRFADQAILRKKPLVAK